MLTSMSATEWGDVDMAELLPTGTVTLLLADVEGSTQLWETQPEAMTAAIARMNETASKLVAEHDGVRPVEQGEGDSFAPRSLALATRWRARWNSSARIFRRSGCASGCTPATSVCATRATTRARRSTRPRGCATWRTAAKPCCRV